MDRHTAKSALRWATWGAVAVAWVGVTSPAEAARADLGLGGHTAHEFLVEHAAQLAAEEPAFAKGALPDLIGGAPPERRYESLGMYCWMQQAEIPFDSPEEMVPLTREQLVVGRLVALLDVDIPSRLTIEQLQFFVDEYPELVATAGACQSDEDLTEPCTPFPDDMFSGETGSALEDTEGGDRGEPEGEEDTEGESEGDTEDEAHSDEDRCDAAIDGLASILRNTPEIRRIYFLLLQAKFALYPSDYYSHRGLLSDTPVAALVAKRIGCESRRYTDCLARASEFDLLGYQSASLEQLGGYAEDLDTPLMEWPAETRARVFANEMRQRLQVNGHGLAEMDAKCQHIPGNSIDDIANLHACQFAAARTSPAANPAFVTAAGLEELYDRLEAQQLQHLRALAIDSLGPKLQRQAAAIGILAILGLFWGLVVGRRQGAAFAVWTGLGIAGTVLGIGLTFGAASVVRHHVEVAFDATPLLSAHFASFGALRDPALIQAVSEQTQDSIDLVQGPLFTLSPDTGTMSKAPANTAVHLLRSWARMVPNLKTHFVAAQSPDETFHFDPATHRPERPGPEAESAGVSAAPPAPKGVMSSLVGLFAGAERLLWTLPYLLFFVIVVFYLNPLRHRLKSLTEAGSAPTTAARAVDMGKQTTQILTAELRALLLVLPLIAALIPTIFELLSLSLRPIFHQVVGASLSSLLLLARGDGATADKVAVIAALGSLAVVFLLCVAVYFGAFAVALGKWREIARAKAHDSVELASHAAFLKRAAAGVLAAFLFPVALTWGAHLLSGSVSFDSSASAASLAITPVLTLVAFLGLFFGLRLVRVLIGIRKYRVAPPTGVV